MRDHHEKRAGMWDQDPPYSPDKVTSMALSLPQCQIHPAHGLDLFLNVCVNLMFNLSHSNFFPQLYSTTCITPKTLSINNVAVYKPNYTRNALSYARNANSDRQLTS